MAKTVEMTSDHIYRPSKLVAIQFKAGCTYDRVIEAAWASIKAAGAGRIVKPRGETSTGVDQ